MASIVDRLRGRSSAELAARGMQALLTRIERLQGIVGGASRSAAARGIGFATDRTFASLRESARGPEDIARAIAASDPEWEANLRAQLSELECGRASLLGHESLPIGDPPRWHREALSAREAPRRHWSLIDHLDASLVGDHKVLWEPNRHQYLLVPAMCWLLDRNERALALVQRHLDSWLAENPPRVGVNWVSSLEVAYRAIAWCWLLWLLRSAPWGDLRARLLTSLEAHGRHIERYLSTYFSPNTHLSGEALGLFYLGTVLQGSRYAAHWRAKGAAILEEWLERQVLPDGVYFEQASQYHRYTTEIYLHYALLAESTGWKASSSVRDALARLFVVLRSLTSGDGRIPLMGDDDGGLLLPLDQRPPDDVRALLLAGAVFLDRPELAPPSAPVGLALWLCGIEPTQRLIRGGDAKPAWTDIYFEEGGLAVLRDGWTSDDAVAVIDAGPHGALSCGHSHADALGMTLAVGRSALFIERGTLTYTGPERNEYRSTRSHNTLEIDDESSVTPGKAFRWLNVPQRATGTVYSGGDITGFAGVAFGHAGGPRPSRHERQVLHLRAGAWVVLDRGERSGARNGCVRWQLAPGLRAERIAERAAAIWSREGVLLATVLAPICRGLRIAARSVSPRFGGEVAAEVLEMDLADSLIGLTVIVPGRAVACTETSLSCSWQDDAGRHQVSLSSLRDGGSGLELSADLCWRIERAARAGETAGPQELIAAAGIRTVGVEGSERFITTPQPIPGKMAVLENVGGRWMDRGLAPVGTHD